MDTLVPAELEVPWRNAAALEGAAELASAVARRLRRIAESLPADAAARADVEAYADRLGVLGADATTLQVAPVQQWLAEHWPRWAAQAAVADVQLRYEPALVEAEAAFDPLQLIAALDEVVGNAIRAAAAGPSDLVRAVTVRVEHIDSDGAEIGPVPPLDSGSYVRLTIADTGAGMDVATRARALHPGDGLGLAIAFGAVRRAGGALWIDSTEGWGTRVFLFIRKAVATVTAATRDVVLVVEDEPHVRAVVRRLLTGQGFHVVESGNGRDALAIAERLRPRLRAVLTDVVMPVMGGRDLVHALRAIDRDLPLLCMSGYSDRPQLLDGIAPPVPLLEKPFTSEQLVASLRAVLGVAR